MLEKNNRRDKTNLINLIGRRSGNTPNFAFLMGAGCSVSSGVKTASEMMAEWRRQLYDQSKSADKFEEWLQKQDWYGDEEEYSILFEKVCDQRSQRRIYIEDCVKEARPSWGYIYLSNIIAHNYFNVIFTPNFDDLLNDACFLYADLRPIVCAHDSAVADIRITSARPKIIKLHGDFLYDSIKNTVKETESLEKNMRDKFVQFANEYGLIVIGYGGNDRSIMETLDILLMSPGYYPNGIYWCKRNGDKVSKKLHRLMRRENVYWVEIEGFDEYMAELHEGLELTLPDAVRDPYKATTEKLNRFIFPTKEVKHTIIKDDIRELEEQVKRFEQALTGKAPSEKFDKFVPYRFLGDTEYYRKNYEKALVYYEKSLLQNPNDIYIIEGIIKTYTVMEKFDKALEWSEKMVRQFPDNYLSYYRKGESLSYLNRFQDAVASHDEALKYTPEKYMRAAVLTNRANVNLMVGNWEEALLDSEKVLEISPKSYTSIINKCIALKKLGKKEEAEKILQTVLPEIKYNYTRACAFATLGEKENMLTELQAMIRELHSKGRVLAKFDPDFADYRDDPDFRKLVYEGVEEGKK